MSPKGINLKEDLCPAKDPRLHIQYLKAVPGKRNWYIQNAIKPTTITRPNAVEHNTAKKKE